MKKIKQNIVHHIQKHHKKYLFASGAVLGRSIVKVILIASMFLWLSAFSQRVNNVDTSNSQIQTYKALYLFYQLDDIAHVEVTRILKEGNPDLMTGLNKFNELDLAFHSAANLNEKFKAAKALDLFLKEQDILLHKLWATDNLDTMFHTISNAFDLIK